ncbi:FAD-dependent oxidoreductase domain-containing protein 1 [Folsomia candida]|uniref:FAD-dependent oxidoreductase domain-containing protein 1 n=1 Tax=Folsomia candida TaxID=158441 RepID=A0A226ENF8_FOLCA|nr:FAD-dependent oxidoreductase domain-containing protein 1 [Folsomia candida]OXA59009.1 FAD-dependent oxidoreductase domain-containing protein 1 [Folsomia candida]
MITVQHMYRKILPSLCQNIQILGHKNRCLSTSIVLSRRRKDYEDEYIEVAPPPMMNPVKRTLNILKHDVRSIWDPDQPPLLKFSSHVDVLVIGGGIMGTAIAYYLKQRTGRSSFSVSVIDKDPTYTKSSTVLSLGGLRQQFSLKENIQMSMFGADFLRRSRELLALDGVPPADIQYHPYGYLYLADEKGAAQLQENWLLQKELGAEVELLGKEKLKERFPWINTDGIEVACHGMENEGWFDAWAFLFGLKRKACELGTEYVESEVVGFKFEEDDGTIVAGMDHDEEHTAIKAAIVRTPTGELKTIHFAYCIIAAGHESGNIAAMARIGRGEGMLSVPLPVEPRKRYVFCYNAPQGPSVPGLDCPMVIDPSGTYFRREGYAGHYVAGRAPPLEDVEPNVENLDVDYTYFDKTVYPSLINRVPGFKNLKLNSGWAGYYDYNTFDENGIVGPHPYYPNIYFACGFSGFGIQQAPGVARATMEMILDGEFKTTDLTRFHFERFLVGKEIREKNVT